MTVSSEDKVQLHSKSAKIMPKTILIMAGGTGGHVFPALAVAEQLRKRGIDVQWLGTRQGLEANVVPRAGIKLHYITITGIRGKEAVVLLMAPFRICMALVQCIIVMLKIRPVAVLGMGGFVAGPGGVIAWLLRRPLLIHEQNAVAGLTNRLLAKLASKKFQGFPDTFPDSFAAITTGNPIREEIIKIPVPQIRYSNREGALRLLILGGSLGAVVLNQVVPAALTMIPSNQRPKVVHQVGRHKKEETLQYYKYANVEAKVVQFIRNMGEAYAWADIVLCRAGALTIAELSAVGIASILVPYPHAVDDHQTRNAKYLCDANAALLIPQTRFTAKKLYDTLASFTDDDIQRARARMLNMAQAAYGQAIHDATTKVTEQCIRVAQIAVVNG